MDRNKPSGDQHSAAVRAPRPESVELLSGAGGGIGGEPGLDATDRQAAPADAGLRLAEDGVLADAARLRGQSEAGAASDADDGAGSDLSQAQHDAGVPRASDLPVFTAG